MPLWEAIEDPAEDASPVWLSRVIPDTNSLYPFDATPEHAQAFVSSADTEKRKKYATGWSPLRKDDCRALNAALEEWQEDPSAFDDEEPQILIENGRCTAFLEQGVIRYNFHRGPARALWPAVWFYRLDSHDLLPVLSMEDAARMEELYQRVLQASSSLGTGVNNVLNDTEQNHIVLHDEPQYKAQIMREDGKLIMRKTSIMGGLSGIFHAAPVILQRGYGPYTVPGEEDESELGPVRHVVFVIHGMAEALVANAEATDAVPGLLNDMNNLRTVLYAKQMERWRKQSAAATRQGLEVPPKPFRTEIIPVEWYQTLRDNAKDIMDTLSKATLKTIPDIRTTVRDGAMDILFYLTPAYTQVVLECVAEMIHKVYDRFLEIYPHFDEDGTAHLVGHSLGSVIAWDLLSILKEQEEEQINSAFSRMGSSHMNGDANGGDKKQRLKSVAIVGEGDGGSVGFSMDMSNNANNSSGGAQIGQWGPTLVRPIEQILPFSPHSAVVFGSPLGLFLTLRGAQSAFDHLRKEEIESEGFSRAAPDSVNYNVSPFTLPTDRFFHIFHRSDPVAYRIESILLSPEVPDSEIPPPRYLAKPGKDVRIHVKAQQVGVWNAVLGALHSATVEEVPEEEEWDFPLGGKNKRVDYCLQPGYVEHEYLAVPTAHISYWGNKDVQDFFLALYELEEKEKSEIGNMAESERLEI